MKNKAFTYILLIVVAVVWYNVFFRVKDNLFGDAQAGIPENQRLATDIKVVSKDTFQLIANYPDPFGAENANWSRPKTNPAITNNPRPPIVERPVFKWPKINYYGMVKKTSSSRPLAILSVDGQQFTLRSGESIYEDITIKRIWRDSVEVKCGKEVRVFVR